MDYQNIEDQKVNSDPINVLKLVKILVQISYVLKIPIPFFPLFQACLILSINFDEFLAAILLLFSLHFPQNNHQNLRAK